MTMPSTSCGPTLLALARASIAQALGLPRAEGELPSWLQKPGACFVTLTQDGQLRGCIGSLGAHRPLGDDVRANAVAAALRDPRFPALTAAELGRTQVEVSVLSPMQPLSFNSEAEALAQLRPHIDGVVLEYGGHRGTFLPQVWEHLPTPTAFMAQLKRKAGLRADFWADGVRLQRYTVEKWQEGGPAP
jgi:AmmeMemoRadiSam system protein A